LLDADWPCDAGLEPASSRCDNTDETSPNGLPEPEAEDAERFIQIDIVCCDFVSCDGLQRERYA